MTCNHEWGGVVIPGPVNRIVIDQCENCGELRLPDARPAQAVDLGPVRAALDAAEGLAVVCASVDGYSREEVAASGRAMRKQFTDARALIDGKAVGK